MMIIALSGLSGCGKNSVGGLLARELGMRTVQMSFKEEAQRRGVSLMDLQAMADADPEFDRKLDASIVAEAAKGDCVVMTWLGPWKVQADLRVWLNAGERERAKRVAERDGMAPAAAVAHVRKRDADNIARYKKYYGIDILNHSGFDLEVNTERLAPEQSSEIIACAAKALDAKKGKRAE